MSTKIQVTILDDHPTILDGYRFQLMNSSRAEIAAAIRYWDELPGTLEHHPTDVLLLDVNVPISKENPSPYPILNVIPELLQKYPKLTILIISMHIERSLIRKVLEAGASGYILKDDQEALQNLENVIVSVWTGGLFLSRQANEILVKGGSVEDRAPLSRRQLEVLSLCLSYPDATTADLAMKMAVTHSTVRNLLSGAYLKLDVRSRIAAVSKARQLGLITPEPPTVPHRT